MPAYDDDDDDDDDAYIKGRPKIGTIYFNFTKY